MENFKKTVVNTIIHVAHVERRNGNVTVNLVSEPIVVRNRKVEPINMQRYIKAKYRDPDYIMNTYEYETKVYQMSTEKFIENAEEVK